MFLEKNICSQRRTSHTFSAGAERPRLGPEVHPCPKCSCVVRPSYNVWTLEPSLCSSSAPKPCSQIPKYTVLPSNSPKRHGSVHTGSWADQEVIWRRCALQIAALCMWAGRRIQMLMPKAQRSGAQGHFSSCKTTRPQKMELICTRTSANRRRHVPRIMEHVCTPTPGLSLE